MIEPSLNVYVDFGYPPLNKPRWTFFLKVKYVNRNFAKKKSKSGIIPRKKIKGEKSPYYLWKP